MTLSSIVPPKLRIWPPQCEIDRGSPIHKAFGPNSAAVPVNDSLNRCQADPGTGKLIGGVKALKSAEETGSVGLIEAGAIVADKEHPIAIGRRFTEFDFRLFSFRRKFPGVADQVMQSNAN
jgi:hypothetical protein